MGEGKNSKGNDVCCFKRAQKTMKANENEMKIIWMHEYIQIMYEIINTSFQECACLLKKKHSRATVAIKEYLIKILYSIVDP